MLRERTPVAGITIAVLVLLLECVGLVAYERRQQDLAAAERARAERAAAEAIREAEAAKAKLDEIMRELDRLDAEVARAIKALGVCEDQTCRSEGKQRLHDAQRRLFERKQRATPEHNDMLIQPLPRELQRGRV